MRRALCHSVKNLFIIPFKRRPCRDPFKDDKRRCPKQSVISFLNRGLTHHSRRMKNAPWHSGQQGFFGKGEIALMGFRNDNLFRRPRRHRSTEQHDFGFRALPAFFFLLVFLNLFFQVAFPVAMHLGHVAVFTQILGNVFLIGEVLQHHQPFAVCLQKDR